MKNFLKILLVYIVIVVPIITLYLSTNTNNQNKLSITKDELSGVVFLKEIYNLSLSLFLYKENLVTHANEALLVKTKKNLDTNIKNIYMLNAQYPQFKNKEFYTSLKDLQESNYEDTKYYAFLDLINHENYRIGDKSKLLFEEDRKTYFLSSLITHYLPEYLISVLMIHNMIEEFLVVGSLSHDQQNLYIEQNKLLYLSVEEIFTIVEFLKSYDDTQEILKNIEKIHSIINDLPEYTKSTNNWTKKDKRISSYLKISYELEKYSFLLKTETFKVLTASLTKREQSLEEDILRAKVILFSLIFAISLVAFYFYRVFNSNIQKDREIKDINKTLDQFVIFSKTDKNGLITYSSSALENLTGYSKSELLGQTHKLFKADDTNPEIYKNMWVTILDKKEWSHEIKNIKKDGSSYWVKVIITPALNNSGEIVGFNSYREDITDQVSLRSEKLKTQKALEFKSMFLSNMSHEIRTPMNAIVGFTQLLLKNNPNKVQLKMLNNIDSTSTILLGIINDILDISKIESGKMSIEKHNFNLSHCVEGVYNILMIKAKEKGISLKIEYDNISNFNILSDNLRLTQILTNLLSNAVKFTDRGSVKLHVEKDENNNFLFEVIDTGIGLKEAQLHTLFDEFTQADMTTSRKYGGTGLGLSISKKLVSMMGGKLEVDSIYGVGSTFKFSLPIALQIDNAINKNADSIGFDILEKEVNALKDINILVAEDNKMNQTLLSMYFENSSINLDMANDGKIALTKFKDGSYDLILMDIQMPNMNGYEATQAIRAIDKDIAIVALSANVMQEDINKALESGMNNHLAKPIDLEKLYKCILQYCKKS